MNIAAIICEYNPFHNGHALHIREARAAARAEYIVCAMSGAWTQRGDPAIVDKWARARMALENGADLVLELPAVWAVRAAEDFALGGVSLLDALGICTHLCFGSELPIDILQAEMARSEDAEAIRQSLSAGHSYPRAVSSGEALRHANATLGVEYLRAINALDSTMQPIIVKREVPHDALELASVTSATRIRQGLMQGEEVSFAMPDSAAHLLEQALARQGGGAHWERITPHVLHVLRGAYSEEIGRAYGVSEGLEHRILRAAGEASTVTELFDRVKCKRYTHARIRRAIAHIMLDIAPQERTVLPSYARVLGFRRESANLLRAIERQAKIPMVTKLSAHIEDPLLATDLRAQELWSLCCPIPGRKGSDYTHPIEVVS